MLYLGNASSPAIKAAMAAGRLGQMCAPGGGAPPVPGARWAADNGCFGKGYPGRPAWLTWLRRHRPYQDRCLFVTAPDVVGDATATLARSLDWLPTIRGLGYQAALVAQDGLEDLAVPWPAFDVLFLGGSTDWKLSTAAEAVAVEAIARGKPVHMGRVNSRRRLGRAIAMGCSTADGTYLSFGPDKNLPRLMRWLDQLSPTEERHDR